MLTDLTLKGAIQAYSGAEDHLSLLPYAYITHANN